MPLLDPSSARLIGLPAASLPKLPTGHAIAGGSPRADDDLAAYAAWKRSQSGTDLDALLRRLDPVVQAEVNRRAGTLSRDLLLGQARKLAVDAIRSFDPNRGVKITTHVVNQLQKLSRVNYTHQNAARIAEHHMLQFHTLRVARDDFAAEHGRDATTEELADHLRWSPSKLGQVQAQFQRSELLEHAGGGGGTDTRAHAFVATEHDPSIGYVYATLSPRQQKIFEHITGYNGAKMMKNPEIMKKMDITQGVLSYEKTRITDAFKRVRG